MNREETRNQKPETRNQQPTAKGQRALFLLILLFCLSLSAQPVDLKDLLIQPDRFDSKIVEIEGEVIGEPIIDREGFWVNISSKGYNLGVFLSSPDFLKKINYWGSYKFTGDYIRIKGIFYKSCSIHQERDLHLKEAKVIKRGWERKELIPTFKIKLAFITFIICLTLMGSYFIKYKIWIRR